jgi:FkbM family methyltransferase
MYAQTPGYGRKIYYAGIGEDAFLQGYFQRKLAFLASQKKTPATDLRKTVTPGYYVDIGAHDPRFYSNTYWFYRQGWRGINVDAAPGTQKLFAKIRPADVNLEALVSDQETEMTFYYWDTPFLVNTLSAEYAQFLAGSWGREPKTIVMRSCRLDTILAEHLPPNQEISFMSIDVEGHDLSVLRSNNWDRFRPELVLAEDLTMSFESAAASEMYQFMGSIGYEIYAWLRPTVVYRQMGLRDWLVHDFHAPKAATAN